MSERLCVQGVAGLTNHRDRSRSGWVDGIGPVGSCGTHSIALNNICFAAGFLDLVQRLF